MIVIVTLFHRLLHISSGPYYRETLWTPSVEKRKRLSGMQKSIVAVTRYIEMRSSGWVSSMTLTLHQTVDRYCIFIPKTRTVRKDYS